MPTNKTRKVPRAYRTWPISLGLSRENAWVNVDIDARQTTCVNQLN